MSIKTAIVGLGVTGYSCLRHLYARDELVVLDTRVAPPHLREARQAYPDVDYRIGVREYDFDGVDRVVVSPGMALDTCLLATARSRGVPFVSDIDLFFASANAPVCGITGTNGKSTVTAMLGHLLHRRGIHAPVGGNLGEAALDLLDENAACYVLELSSFQLERMETHHFKAATILNVSEDHLDRHGDLAGYIAAKHRIYADAGLCVYNRDDAATLPPGETVSVSFGSDDPRGTQNWGVGDAASERTLMHGDRPILPVDQMPVDGLHNEQNALAAFALSGLADQDLGDALTGYQGLPHRSQPVRTIDNVRFVNDSKATNVGATLAALGGLGGTAGIHLIAGGDGKAASFTPLKPLVGKYVKKAYLIGMDAPRMAAELNDQTDVQIYDTLEQAVEAAATDARKAGEQRIVLLSPACASLDMFPSYRVRGDRFAEIVEALA
jgi:UDP-N-acetylmuramoylalanine--D-glutamate ligase